MINYILSIVTINKNNANGLERTLKSFERLRGDVELEFIFIDGLSDDDSLKVAEKYYYPNEIYVEPDSGIYNAMNKGLYRSKGKYVIWINSGDGVIAENIRDVKDVLLSSEECLIGFGVNMMGSIDDVVIEKWFSNINDLPVSTFPHQASFFKREELLTMGGYDEKYKIAGDRELVVRLYLEGRKIKTIKRVFGVFYKGGVSFTRNSLIESIEIDKKYNISSFFRRRWRIMRYDHEKLLGPIKRAIVGGL